MQWSDLQILLNFKCELDANTEQNIQVKIITLCRLGSIMWFFCSVKNESYTS